MSDVETAILSGAWENRTYEQIAQASGYSVSYLTRDIGPRLWKLLSQALGEPVSKTNFRAALDRQSSQGQPKPPHSEQRIPSPTEPPENLQPLPAQLPRCDWGEAVDVSFFCGRVPELSTLKQWILQERSQLVALLGMGGIGKTSLAVKLAQEIQANFEVVVWRSLRNAPPLETLASDLVPFLSDQQDTQAELGRLMHWLRACRCLLILDNVEAILQAGDAAGQYRPGYENYANLFRMLGEMAHPSCLLLTSREKPAEVAIFEGIGPVHSLHLAGSPEVAQVLIQTKGLAGSEYQKQELGRRYGYNPLALRIVTTSIQDLFDGEIGEFLDQDAVIFNSVRRLLDQQFERLSWLEQSIMYWLTINREWTTISSLSEDIVPPVSRAKLLEALESLSWRSLIEKRTGSYTQQSVVMEYMTERLIETMVTEIETQKLSLFVSHALMKTTVKAYIRESQIRLILGPTANKLRILFYSEKILRRQLQEILGLLQDKATHASSYGGGNLINLCCHLGLDLTNHDFSNLTIWHADLQKVHLPRANFAHSNFAKSVFTQTFGAISAVTFSPDGQLLAIGEAHGKIRLWCLADSQPLLTLPGHIGWIQSVRFSADGRTLVSSGDDQTVRLWDVRTGQLLKVLQGHTSRVWSVRVSPDGHTLASGSGDCTVKLWDVQTGQCLQTLQGHTAQVSSVDFSSDGCTLASGSFDQSVRLWDVQTGQCLRTLSEHHSWVWSVRFSCDGQILASGSSDRTVKLWDARTGQLLNTLLGHTEQISSISFSPDGHTLASGSNDQTVRLWDVRTGQLLSTLQGHTKQIWSISFSPDGYTLATGGNDQTVRLWDAGTGQLLSTLQGHTAQVSSIDFSSDGLVLASGDGDCVVRLWEVHTGQLWQTLQGHTNWVLSVGFSPGGNMLASGSADCTVKLWDRQSGQLLNTLSGHSSWVWSVDFSPDGHMLASGSFDQTVRLWDAHTAQCLQILPGHHNLIWSVRFSPDGRTLATGSNHHAVKLWDVCTGQVLDTLMGHTSPVWSVTWSPDGRTLASGSADCTVKLWDVRTGQLLHTLQGHGSWVWSVAWSPDGHTLASGSYDRTVKLWDTHTGEVLKTLQGHTNWVSAVAFSPDGQTLASGSIDETIQLWEIKTAEVVKTLRAERPYEGMNITQVTGLTEAQKATLKALGAVENSV